MFSYRHGFHAGNHADVLKHMVVVQLLESTCCKRQTLLGGRHPRRRWLYDLTSGYATKSVASRWRAFMPFALRAKASTLTIVRLTWTRFRPSTTKTRCTGTPARHANRSADDARRRPPAPVRIAPQRNQTTGRAFRLSAPWRQHSTSRRFLVSGAACPAPDVVGPHRPTVRNQRRLPSRCKPCASRSSALPRAPTPFGTPKIASRVAAVPRQLGGWPPKCKGRLAARHCVSKVLPATAWAHLAAACSSSTPGRSTTARPKRCPGWLKPSASTNTPPARAAKSDPDRSEKTHRGRRQVKHQHLGLTP